jgi:hypothetical protein
MSKAQFSMADTVGRYVERVFEKRDSPADHGRDIPGFVIQVFQMVIPCGKHEEV